ELAAWQGRIPVPLQSGEPLYLSGESATKWIRQPESLTFYSEKTPLSLLREHRWRADTEKPNIFVRRKFWHDPSGEEAGVQRAPWILVYADLMSIGDGRLREAAHRLRDAHA